MLSAPNSTRRQSGALMPIRGRSSIQVPPDAGNHNHRYGNLSPDTENFTAAKSVPDGKELSPVISPQQHPRSSVEDSPGRALSQSDRTPSPAASLLQELSASDSTGDKDASRSPRSVSANRWKAIRLYTSVAEARRLSKRSFFLKNIPLNIPVEKPPEEPKQWGLRALRKTVQDKGGGRNSILSNSASQLLPDVPRNRQSRGRSPTANDLRNLTTASMKAMREAESYMPTRLAANVAAAVHAVSPRARSPRGTRLDAPNGGALAAEASGRSSSLRASSGRASRASSARKASRASSGRTSTSASGAPPPAPASTSISSRRSSSRASARASSRSPDRRLLSALGDVKHLR